MNYNSPNLVLEAKQKTTLVIIWLHGLGASDHDLLPIANTCQMQLPTTKHILPHAPIRPVTINNGMQMRAWYDIKGGKLVDKEDKEGVLKSQTMIETQIKDIKETGVKAEQILLAGFSQGGAMALYTGLQHHEKLAGLIALSAYLPLAQEQNLTHSANKNIPIFMASGLYDPLVRPEWTKLTYDLLVHHQFHNITSQTYPMEHNICPEEVNDIIKWLKDLPNKT